MIDAVNAYEQSVGARLLDFFDSRTPWHRRLWAISPALTLSEILEAIEAVQGGVLSEDSLNFLTNSAQKLAGLDPGVGDVRERQTLQQALRGKLRVKGLDYHVIGQQQQRLATQYLRRWAAVVRAQGAPVEQAARALASHLLDLGFSSDYLHRWWSFRLLHEPPIRPLADLVAQAEELTTSKAREYEVLAPVLSAASKPAMRPSNWLDAQQVSKWLRANQSDPSGLRQDGGLLLKVWALDAEAAVERAAEKLDALTSRIAVGTKRGVTFSETVWVAGDPQLHSAGRTNRGVWVRALERERQLFNLGAASGIEASIELLSHLQRSSPAAAVAGGWAAIEALLSEPHDRGAAADRLAMLVACSFPRAELTSLSYSLPRVDSAWAALLHGVQENRVRAEVVARALLDGTPSLASANSSDRAAVSRLLEILWEPRGVLGRVQEYVTGTFRRLYRQRNLVLHGAMTEAVALRASLRTAAPLVGAGIDRVVHAAYVDHRSPLELVARAKVSLATVDARRGSLCLDLLG